MSITDKERLDFLEKYIFTKSSVVPYILFSYETWADHVGDEENKENFPVAMCMDYENKDKNRVYFGRSIRETIDQAMIAIKDKANDET